MSYLAIARDAEEHEDHTLAQVMHSLASSAEMLLKDFARDPYYRRELILNFSKIAEIQRDINLAIEEMWRSR